MDEQLKNEISRLSAIVTEGETYVSQVPDKIIGYEAVYVSFTGGDGFCDKPVYSYKDVEKRRPKYPEPMRDEARGQLIILYNEHKDSRRLILSHEGISKRDIFDHNHPQLSDAVQEGGCLLGCGAILALWGGIAYGGYSLFHYLANMAN